MTYKFKKTRNHEQVLMLKDIDNELLGIEELRPAYLERELTGIEE